MKIHQLPMGARFEYEGREYVKTGPLLGTCDDSQRLIPKYAVLRPLGEVAPLREMPSETLMRADVVAAFRDFCTRCEPLLDAERRGDFEAARQDFLKALGN